MNGSEGQDHPDPVARAQAAALELQSALSDLCALGFHVTVRVEEGFEDGALSPSAYYVEVDVT